MYANKIDDVNSEEYQPHFRVLKKQIRVNR